MVQKYFTKEGLKKIEQELQILKTVKRQEIAQRLHETAGYGDLSENSEYQEAKEAQAHLEAKIADLEENIRSAVIAPPIKAPGVVEIGSVVTVQNKQKETCQFTLVGVAESAPAEGKISVESPLGNALLGHSKNDIIDVDTPGGKKVYKIIQVA